MRPYPCFLKKVKSIFNIKNERLLVTGITPDDKTSVFTVYFPYTDDSMVRFDELDISQNRYFVYYADKGLKNKKLINYEFR